MKKASKVKGLGWDVFGASGSSGNTEGAADYVELQHYAAPEDATMRPAFKSDAEAIEHVIDQARAGDAVCIDALWDVLGHDELVERSMWGVK